VQFKALSHCGNLGEISDQSAHGARGPLNQSRNRDDLVFLGAPRFLIYIYNFQLILAIQFMVAKMFQVLNRT